MIYSERVQVAQEAQVENERRARINIARAQYRTKSLSPAGFTMRLEDIERQASDARQELIRQRLAG